MLITKENANSLMPKVAQFIQSELKAGNSVELEINRVELTRSNAQNRLLWGVWYKEIVQHLKDHHGVHASPDAIHEDIVQRLGYYKVKSGLNGDVIVREQTRKMSVKRFTQLLNDLEQYSITNWGLYLSHPEDIYYMAMGR